MAIKRNHHPRGTKSFHREPRDGLIERGKEGGCAHVRRGIAACADGDDAQRGGRRGSDPRIDCKIIGELNELPINSWRKASRRL